MNNTSGTVRAECDAHHVNLAPHSETTQDWAYAITGVNPDVTVWFARNKNMGQLVKAGQTITYDGSSVRVSD